MPDHGLTEGAKTAGAIAGTGVLGFVLGLLRFEAKFMRRADCERNQQQCNKALHATLTAIKTDLTEIKEEQKLMRQDLYQVRK